MNNKKIIGPYELLEEIGRGGTSLVYKAQHPAHTKKLALKIFHPCVCAEQHFLDYYTKQVVQLGSLHHPNILDISDFNQDNDQYYVVYDFVEGFSLRKIIEETGPISLKTMFSIVQKISSALSAAHRKGILHLNLKSSNILIDRSCQTFVSDFAFTKNICLQGILEEKIHSEDIASTFGYIAPEQLYPAVGDISPATDIYSLGIILFEMLSGQLPFSEQQNPINMAHMHIVITPPRLLKFRKDLDPRFEQLIMKMLDKDPKNRFQSIREFDLAFSEIERLTNNHVKNPDAPTEPLIQIATEDKSFTASFEDFSKTFDRKTFEEIFKAKHPSFPPMEERIIQKRYRIDRLMAHLMLSNVYLGFDLQENTPVTLQVPLQSSPGYLQRIEEDFNQMKTIQHHGFVRLLDMVHDDGFIFVVREFIKGLTLKNIAKSGKLRIEKAIQITLNILDALSYLHRQGMIHRDLNSEVILVTPSLKVKITNMVIIRAEDASSVSSRSFMGIVQYTPPEQISQCHYDLRSDLYSVGILLFELLTGSPPFNSNQPIEIMDMHMKKAPRFPENMQTLIPLNLQFIVLKALSKLPEDRYQSAKEFFHALNDFLVNYAHTLHSSPNITETSIPSATDPASEKDKKKAKSRKKTLNLMEAITGQRKNKNAVPIPESTKAEPNMQAFSEIGEGPTPGLPPDSSEYTQWLYHTLGLEKTAITILKKSNPFDFQIFTSPEAVEKKLIQKIQLGHSARMLASSCWPWSNELDVTQELAYDIVLGEYKRPWHAHPDIVRLPKNVPRASFWPFDPNGFQQIGRIDIVHELEFDYIGLIFGKDLCYRFQNSSWHADPEASFDPRVQANPAHVLKLLKNNYLTLLSRGLRGCYVYFMDKDTENYFKNRIQQE